MMSDVLWDKVKEVTETAKLRNQIFSIDTKNEYIEDKGMKV